MTTQAAKGLFAVASPPHGSLALLVLFLDFLLLVRFLLGDLLRLLFQLWSRIWLKSSKYITILGFSE